MGRSFQGTRDLIVAVAVGVLAGLAAGGCRADGKALPARDDARPPTPASTVSVSVATVVQKPMPVVIDAIGAAEASSVVAVHAQVTGELTSVNFKDGDEVAAGQELFALDRRPLEAALRQAQANLDRDVAQLANARAQLQRYQDLTDRGIATREQLDQMRTAVAALEATSVADRAAVENADVQLAYATIHAPIGGRTGKLLVNVGNLVRANDTAPLVVINQVAPIYAVFAIPEAQLPDLKAYMARGPLRVEARPPNTSEPPSVGRVAFFDNSVDQTTGTIAVRATFPNEDRRLWPGQFVNITVILDTDAHAVVIPSTAVQDSQQGKTVFVVRPDKTVEQRTVHVKRTADSETVVSDGVSAGELVVTDGQLRLIPGTPVSIRPSGRAGSPS
jgi:multidrug efflux system membrane fusion protein